MIPKIIHYCWLSGEEKPQRILDCIESWRRVMPDYQIVCWDMDRFDIHSVPWVEQACACRKWAFAADYIRLYALYHFGGIYLDSDVRVLKPFDPFLNHRAFGGIELWEDKLIWRKDAGIFDSLVFSRENDTGINIEAAIMGAEKGHPVFKAFLDYYEGRPFELEKIDDYIMPWLLSRVAFQFGFHNDEYRYPQVLEHDYHLYPYDYFTTQGGHPGDMSVTENTVAIHLVSLSWYTPKPPTPPEPRRLHSRYTEWRLHTIAYFKNLWRDVILHKPHKKES